MRIAIVGDSQAQATGKVLQDVLRAQGHTVSRFAKAGASTPKLAVAYGAEPAWPADVLVVFTGGNNSPGQVPAVAAALRTLAEHSGKPRRVVVVGPPPATLIADVSKAKAAFGRGVASSDHWFTSGKAQQRHQLAYDVAKAAEANGAEFVFWRTLGIGGQKQPDGTVFPSQADGIHVAGPWAQASAERIAQLVVAGPQVGSPVLVAGGITLGGLVAAYALGKLVEAITGR